MAKYWGFSNISKKKKKKSKLPLVFVDYDMVWKTWDISLQYKPHVLESSCFWGRIKNLVDQFNHMIVLKTLSRVN